MIGTFPIAAALLLMFTPHLRSLRRVSGLLALGALFYVAGDLLAGSRWEDGLAAGSTAYWAWVWWNSGAGDGPKRRLKAWRRKFHGRRRTAPVFGAA